MCLASSNMFAHWKIPNFIISLYRVYFFMGWVPHGVEGQWFDPQRWQLGKVVYLDEKLWTHTKTNSNRVIEFVS